MIPPMWLSHGSVARRSRVPRAALSSLARLSAPSVRTIEVVLQHDAGAVAPDGAGVIRFGDEGMACHLVLLAAMKDEPDSRFAVGLDIARGDFLRCAVHHDIGRAKQVVETACHVETASAHGRGAIRICREKREALRARHPGPPIGGDIGHAGHLHVILGGDGVRHPFPRSRRSRSRRP